MSALPKIILYIKYLVAAHELQGQIMKIAIIGGGPAGPVLLHPNEEG